MADWTEEDQKSFVAMLEAGASAQRIAVRLKRPVNSIKTRARELGKPFPPERDLTKARRRLLYPSQ